MNYFDNAATTFPKPEVVYETMDSFYRQHGVNVGRGIYKEASIAYSCVEETRDLIRKLFHVNKSYDVVFTQSATIALNQVIRGIKLKPNDVVYISPFEHNAVLRTLFDEQRKINFKIEYLNVDKKDLLYNIGIIRQDFSKCTPTYIILSHASNVFGVVAPIKDIFTLAKQYNAVTICDFAQTAGILDVSLIESFVDYAVFTGHKALYGPFGVGGIVSKYISKLSPFIYGGTGIDSKNPYMPNTVPEGYEAGSINIQAIAGLNAALKWIEKIEICNIRNCETLLTNQLLRVLKKYRNISIIRSDIEQNNIGVISCIFEGYTSDEIGQILSNSGIAVRTGLHCAPKGHEFLGTFPQGTVRFSISYFTSNEDIEQLDKCLDIIEKT